VGGLPQRPEVARRLDANGGGLDRLGAQFVQLFHQPRGLGPAAGYHDPAAGERPLLEPLELVAQPHDLANDDEGRGFHAGLGGLARQVAQRGGQHLLARRGAPVDDGRRRGGVHIVGDQVLGNDGQVGHAHVEDQRAFPAGQGLPVEGGVGLVVGLVAGDERHAARQAAVRYWDAGIRRRRDGRRDAGDDLEGDAGLDDLQGLLAAAAEDHGVAALEAHHPLALALAGLVDKELVDLGLRQGVLRGLLAHVDAFGGGRGVVQQTCGDEGVVDHHVSPGQHIAAANREKSWIARPRADQEDLALTHPLSPSPKMMMRPL
jgi:hypothetical protein